MRKTIDKFVSINDELSVVYSRWENGSVYRRLSPLWSGLRILPYVPPSANRVVASLAERGVEWVLAEHVSITVAGSVRYLYETADGTVEDFGEAGNHNVDNGGGYLPVDPFTRWCRGDHVSCCVLRDRTKPRTRDYTFEIANSPDDSAWHSHEVEGLKGTFIIVRLV